MTIPQDQASGLRQANDNHALPQLPALAITGGKGGVGKTCVSVNLAVHLHRLGLKPLLVDGDLGLANADALMGVNPRTSLYEVVSQQLPLEQAICPTPHDVDLLPAASGVEELTRLSPQQLRGFVQQLAAASKNYDLLLLDTAAGIGREVMTMLSVSKVVLVVVTPEPTSLTDAYALIKVLHQQQPNADLRILINQAESDNLARKVFARLQAVTKNYLQRDLTYIGSLPRDRAVRDAIHNRRPFARDDRCPASTALKGVAIKLKGEVWKSA